MHGCAVRASVQVYKGDTIVICTKCLAAGEANKNRETYIAIGLHDQCKGCECQHKTGEGWYKK
jgi:hypothetical protein